MNNDTQWIFDYLERILSAVEEIVENTKKSKGSGQGSQEEGISSLKMVAALVERMPEQFPDHPEEAWINKKTVKVAIMSEIRRLEEKDGD